jgi:hypothetical protein
MNNILIDRYLSLIEPLSFDLKLELISGITDSLKRSTKKPIIDKKELFLELKGSWKDVSDSIEEEIYSSRTYSDKEIKFD